MASTSAILTNPTGYLAQPQPKINKHLSRVQPPSVPITLDPIQHESRRDTSASDTSHASSRHSNPFAKPQRLHLGMFEIGKPLGKGKFGRVYLARHRSSGFVCALKVLNKEEIRREDAENHVRREIEVHSNLRHPGIVGFYNWFHDSRRIFLILGYTPGGELYKSLRKQGRFSERRAAKYACQVALALRYLHSKNIMHRDLKPENILVGIHGELKLADFGYSVHAPGNRRETLCGTLDYLPPEMLAGPQVNYTKAVDQWTLGVLTYEFLTGEAPFEDSPAITKKRIRKGDMTPLPSSISPEARDFVYSLLRMESTKRLSLDGALEHPWIKKHCVDT